MLFEKLIKIVKKRSRGKVKPHFNLLRVIHLFSSRTVRTDQAALGNPLVPRQESGDRGFKPHASRAWLHLGLY